MGHLGQMPPLLLTFWRNHILLIKIQNFMSGPDPLTHENYMHILVAFITNSPETKTNYIAVKLPPAPSCVLSASKNNYRIAVV